MGLFKTSVFSLKALRRLESFLFQESMKQTPFQKFLYFNETKICKHFLFLKVYKDLCMQSSVSVVNAYCPCWGAYMSDTVLNGLCLWSHLIFTTDLEDGHYYAHLIEEETEVNSNLPKRKSPDMNYVVRLQRPSSLVSVAIMEWALQSLQP